MHGGLATNRLDLPPPYRLVALREAGDAFTQAQAIAPSSGGGTLVHVGRFDMAEFAVVLEPDETLSGVRRIVCAGMLALLDALAVQAPPRHRMGFVWPDAIEVEGGLVGGARLAWPPHTPPDAVPDWLVFGVMLRVFASAPREPGAAPAALDQAGFEDLDPGRLIESCARHLLLALDTWQQNGFGPVARRYLQHLIPPEEGAAELDENGDLLIRRGAPGGAARQSERRSLAEALAEAAWFDPATGEPRR
jgi:hypothetical protein